MCELKSCLLGRYLFFWPPQPRRVVVTSLEPGSGCSNKVGRFGFLAGRKELLINAMNPSHLPPAPRVDARNTKRGGKGSKAPKDALVRSRAWHGRARTQGEVKHELREALGLFKCLQIRAAGDAFHSVAEQTHLQIQEGARRVSVSPSVLSEDVPRP